MRLVDKLLKDNWYKGDHDRWVALIDGSKTANLKAWLAGHGVKAKSTQSKRDLASEVIRKAEQVYGPEGQKEKAE